MRLHIGATRHQLAAANAAALRTDDWVHLGEQKTSEQPDTNESECEVPSGYVSFHFAAGDLLPFPDDHFTFAFSEHFFEHLFLNEAAELFRECWRVLKPGACLRTIVPDADLRSYLPPEPAGFTNGDERWYHPDKHKTRWSIYSLPYVLDQIGFRTQGVVYCDKFGEHVIRNVAADDSFYNDCLDQEIVVDTSYICRFHNSLVVDAMKP